MFMLVSMALTLMQGHSGSAKTQKSALITTTKPAISRIKLATTVGQFLSDLDFWKRVHGLTILYLLRCFRFRVVVEINLVSPWCKLRGWLGINNEIYISGFQTPHSRYDVVIVHDMTLRGWLGVNDHFWGGGGGGGGGGGACACVHARVYQCDCSGMEKPQIKSGFKYMFVSPWCDLRGWLGGRILNNNFLHPSIHPSIYLSIYVSIYYLSIYLSIYLPTYLSIYLYICLSIYYLSIYLFIYLSIYLSVCLSIYLSTYLSTYLPIYLSIDLSIYLSIYRSIYLSICLSIYISIYLSIYRSVYLSVYLYIYISIYPAQQYSFLSCRQVTGPPIPCFISGPLG